MAEEAPCAVFKPSDNADILDPEFPGEGEGNTQMHDFCIEMGIVPTPILNISHDELQAMAQEATAQQNPLARKGVEKLEELEDRIADDVLHKLREQRRLELRARAGLAIFGDVLELDGQKFETDVKQASATHHVALLLWRTRCSACDVMKRIFAILAAKFREVKFVTLNAEQGFIANFPLAHCPAVLVYRHGAVVKQFATLSAFAGTDTDAQVVEWELSELDVVRSDLNEDPRLVRSQKRYLHRKAEGGRFITSRRVKDEDTDPEKSESDG
jgi:thiol-disulfide isomerase/thioredoxin